jgi:predicted PurR-regulated permease PerM
LLSIPLAGPWLAKKWLLVSAAGQGALAQHLAPYTAQFVKWLLLQLGSFGLLIVEFLLVTIISAILYATGETAANGVMRFARRLGGERGENSAILAAQAIRAVALGIIVTALIQAAFAGIGLAIAGVPYTGALTALMIVLGIAQIGSGPVVLLATIWLFWQGESGWGTFMLVWLVIVTQIDNFLRPFLIKRGVDLPLLLIFAGVIGGLLSMGIIGLFIGPLVLAVTYTLLVAWVKDAESKSV